VVSARKRSECPPDETIWKSDHLKDDSMLLFSTTVKNSLQPSIMTLPAWPVDRVKSAVNKPNTTTYAEPSFPQAFLVVFEAEVVEDLSVQSLNFGRYPASLQKKQNSVIDL
jgi:hypothetical protein